MRRTHGEIIDDIADERDWGFKMNMSDFDVEKELMAFIEEEKFKAAIGSGDDCYYATQIEEYVLSQKPFWCGAIKHFYEKGYKAKSD